MTKRLVTYSALVVNSYILYKKNPHKTIQKKQRKQLFHVHAAMYKASIPYPLVAILYWINLFFHF